MNTDREHNLLVITLLAILVGVVAGAIAGIRLPRNRPPGDLQAYVAVDASAPLSSTLRALRRTKPAAALVFGDPGKPDPESNVGVVSADEIAEAAHRDAELMA